MPMVNNAMPIAHAAATAAFVIIRRYPGPPSSVDVIFPSLGVPRNAIRFEPTREALDPTDARGRRGRRQPDHDLVQQRDVRLST
jgi:hypothetical protein